LELKTYNLKHFEKINGSQRKFCIFSQCPISLASFCRACLDL